MFKVMQQYGTVAQPATVYYCDDEADLQNIKSAPMGAQALVIHTGKDSPWSIHAIRDPQR